MSQERELTETAHEMAEAARQAILPLFRSGALGTENKESRGFDPVTRADRAAEEAMREVLARRRPDDAIFGEEFGVKQGSTGYEWVLDPIDGTRAFICGAPSWGVLISVCDASGPVYGIIDQPYIGERFEGGFGQAKMVGPHGDRDLKARKGRKLDQALLMTTFPEVGTEKERAAFERVAGQARLTRYGMDCYAYALLAAGQIDLVIEAGLQRYDIAAPIAVLEAAGAVVTNWEGKPAHFGGQVIAAGSPELHAEALELMARQKA